MQKAHVFTMLGGLAILTMSAATSLSGDDYPNLQRAGEAGSDPAVAALHNWGQLSPDFLGVRPDPTGLPVLEVLFAGSAPAVAPPVVPMSSYSISIIENLDLVPAVIRYDEVVDETPDGPSMPMASPPVPEDAEGLGPGSHLIITIPGEGTFGCTANYVWEDGSDWYLGAAGHCFLPESEKATHGEPAGGNYDASGVTVKVCIDNCRFGGQAGFFITGDLVTLGDVVYARQTGPGGDVGNDFGLVEIPTSLHSDTRTQMPVWGGPQTEGKIGFATPVVLYGNAAGLGEVYTTMGRAGYSILNPTSSRWAAELPAFQGDSGSAVNTGAFDADDVLKGEDAGGVLTHLVGGLEVVAGTTIGQSKTMAGQAGLSISVKT